MSGTTGLRRASSVLLVAALLVSVGLTGDVQGVAAAFDCDPATSDCPVEPTLAPPGDQERVKNDDEVRAGGTVHRDWEITSAEIQYRRADGSAARSSLPVTLTRSRTALGHDRLSSEPIHIGATNGAATIVLSVAVEHTSGETYRGTSPPLTVDNVSPFIVGYQLVAPDRIRVAFSEPVRRPDGAGGYRDNPLDWTIDDQAARAVEGDGDRRVLVLNQRYSDGDRPLVQYSPAAGSVVPSRTYQDLAAWSLTGENRVAYASDGIPPEIPDILDVNGSTADPVIGASTAPRVRVGKLDGATRVQLWRDSLENGDRDFEPGRDVLLAEVTVPDGATEVTFTEGDYSQELPEGDATHTLFARSMDQAGNPSPGVDSVRYRLDPTVPRAVSATGDGRFVTVRFSEDVHGTNRPDDWSVTSGGPVESVTGSGSTRVVRTASPATGHISWEPPAAGSGATPYRDANGNEVEAFRLEIRRPGDIRAGDASAVEGTALNFTVTLARPSGDTGTYSVDYVTEDGTAVAGEDYTSRSGRLTFSGDETSLAVLVPTVQDDRPEGSETLTLQLSNPSNGATVAAPGTATGTITDTAPGGDGSAAISIFDTRGHEGATARAVVQLAEAATEDVTVRWATEDGTAEAGSDYTAGSGTVRIPAGTREVVITVPLLEDDAAEPTETFSIRLTDPVNGTLQRAVATISIFDGPGVPPGVGRVDGPSRVETSAEVSKAFYDSADTVVVATANAYPDALAGAPLAEKHEAPILLTTPERLHPATTAEVKRLGATTALVLGGPQALSSQVDRDLRAAGVTTVRRLAGHNRFDTARIIAADVGGDAVYVVEGNNRDPKRGWPDAVAVSALAAGQQRPILLVERDRLPGETSAALDRLDPSRATIVGGPAAVNDSVERAVDARAGTVDRVAGRTRYETSRAVAQRSVQAGFDPGNTFFATGDDWPDSLSASPAVSRTGGVLLLVDSDRLDDSPPAREWLVTYRDRLRSITLIGGTKAISETVASQIRSQSGLQPR